MIRFDCKVLSLLFPILLTIFGASAGCEKKGPPSQISIAQRTGRISGKTLKIGLIPEQNIFRQKARYTPLANYLSSKLGMKIELQMLSRYGNIIDNFRSLSLDGAFFGSFTYALAHEKIGVEAIVRPENLDGTSTYYGMVFVRKDSGIRSINDLKGKRFAFVDKATTAGYLLPLDYFMDYDVDDYRSFLGEVYFTGSHEDSIYDVINRDADAGAAKNTVFYRLAGKDPRILNELLILKTSPEVPSNGLALRKDLDNLIRKKIEFLLLNMHAEPEGKKDLEKFGARRFIKTTNEDYEPVYSYAKHLGIDLARYKYKND